MKPWERKEVQSQFMSGKLRIVVATIAFGMGLDKTDVRGVIHFNPPRTLEHYVQVLNTQSTKSQDGFKKTEKNQ